MDTLINAGSIPELAQQLSYQLTEASASDLHLTPRQDQFHIDIRKHGVLQPLSLLKKSMGLELINHWKVQASLDLTLKDLPQDGSILSSDDRNLSLRISTCPTLFGEKMVLRLHAHSASAITLDQLGMTDAQQLQYQQALQANSGLILVAGPTGSGKTTTLYAGLNNLKQKPLHIISIEDPIEVHLPHVTQINTHANFDFSDALRTTLRQDPDVLMIGEIRDRATAEIAISASQTGHLVLATVHAADVEGAFYRLQNLGVCLKQLTQQLRLVISQQLIQNSCSERVGLFHVLTMNAENRSQILTEVVT